MANINWKKRVPSEVQEPTPIDMLMLAVADLDTQRANDKYEIELAIAELAEAMLGGG